MGVEWVQANLVDRSGLAEAPLNVDIVVHCATNPLRLGGRVDVEGTAALLEHGSPCLACPFSSTLRL